MYHKNSQTYFNRKKMCTCLFYEEVVYERCTKTISFNCLLWWAQPYQPYISMLSLETVCLLFNEER